MGCIQAPPDRGRDATLVLHGLTMPLDASVLVVVAPQVVPMQAAHARLRIVETEMAHQIVAGGENNL